METEKLHQIGKYLGLTGVELAQFIKEEAELKREELKIRQQELKREFPVVDEVTHHNTANTKVKYPKLPLFNDMYDNIDAYLQRFERFARNADWPEEVWAISLASLLQGKALDIYHQLTPTEANSFELVKSALLRDLIVLLRVLEQHLEIVNFHGLFLKERSLKTLQDLQENADRFLEAHGNQVTRVTTHQCPRRYSALLNPPRPASQQRKKVQCGARPPNVRGKTSKPQLRKEDTAATVSSVVIAPETNVKWNRGETKENERNDVDGEELCGGTLAKGKKLKTARGEVEGRKVVVLRDTGMFNGYAGRVSAVCLPQPLCDLIIGEIPGVSIGEGDARTEKCGVMTRMQIRRDRGLLYRQVTTGKRQRDQLVVPQTCRQATLELAHSGIMGGHLGTSKTRDRILAHFFWPGVTVAVTRYCRSCDVCQRTVDRGKVSKIKLGDMPLIGEPFSRMVVDLLGPLEPRSSNGSRYILTAVDYATRYPEAVALPNIDMPTVAEALVTIFSKVGVPREILSDRGTQFTSDVMKEVYRLLSIQSLTTTPYHAMLPQASTGFSPFELIYGHTVRGPLTLLRELWDGSMADERFITCSYADFTSSSAILPSHSSRNSVSGPLTVCPYISSNGENPVLAWDKISLGTPTLLKIVTKASATVGMSMFGRATASGYLVA
ncbi:uncharacterized protein LOC119591123 [Penaeus monodon]|uniref:uncharacterized protein LOC119591123 n=1 Tax=Penaeus monodon TaxID=6687 RepID=UPI0018A7A9CD|nr:uncharacterized protein LOC119591123 [Penaeus monodon]